MDIVVFLTIIKLLLKYCGLNVRIVFIKADIRKQYFKCGIDIFVLSNMSVNCFLKLYNIFHAFKNKSKSDEIISDELNRITTIEKNKNIETEIEAEPEIKNTANDDTIESKELSLTHTEPTLQTKSVIEEQHENVKDKSVRFTFYITYAFLMTTATVTFIEAIRTNDPLIRNILNFLRSARFK